MAFSDKDKIPIKNLHDSTWYGTNKLRKEFLEKGWSKSGLSSASCLP